MLAIVHLTLLDAEYFCILIDIFDICSGTHLNRVDTAWHFYILLLIFVRLDQTGCQVEANYPLMSILSNIPCNLHEVFQDGWLEQELILVLGDLWEILGFCFSPALRSLSNCFLIYTHWYLLSWQHGEDSLQISFLLSGWNRLFPGTLSCEPTCLGLLRFREVFWGLPRFPFLDHGLETLNTISPGNWGFQLVHLESLKDHYSLCPDSYFLESCLLFYCVRSSLVHFGQWLMHHIACYSWLFI